jgi:uncharacterized damage-inducible protein DinB
MPEVIKELYEYNRWANHRLQQATSGLTTEQFTRDLRNSFPSIRDTLAHIMSAEWIWLSRWLGTSPSGMPESWKSSTRGELLERWMEVESAQMAFVAKVTAEQLTAVIDYRNTQGQPFSNPLGDLMRHVVNHSTYHRGQVATMLRQLGEAAVSTDLVLFYRERTTAEPVAAR